MEQLTRVRFKDDVACHGDNHVLVKVRRFIATAPTNDSLSFTGRTGFDAAIQQFDWHKATSSISAGVGAARSLRCFSEAAGELLVIAASVGEST